ncbi:hypothetical protein KM043_017268 [Ampulex compressa]|nr:hypothetical protein KM043_017268 [Ampulex compressa]
MIFFFSSGTHKGWARWLGRLTEPEVLDEPNYPGSKLERVPLGGRYFRTGEYGPPRMKLRAESVGLSSVLERGRYEATTRRRRPFETAPRIYRTSGLPSGPDLLPVNSCTLRIFPGGLPVSAFSTVYASFHCS